MKQVSNNNKIFWLASYPKSGNTWFRIFLTSLLSEDRESLDLNNIGYGQEPGYRKNFDELNGFNSTDLTQAEINQIRPAGLSWINIEANVKQYFKTHSAYVYNQDQSPVLGSNQTGVAGALYFVRNPLDVCISYAHHSALSIDQSIELMARKKMKSHQANRTDFIPEEMGSWSENVSSWTNLDALPVLTIRYEDMLTDSIATFTKACDFLKLGKDSAAIEKAIDDCRFEKLQALEKDNVFVEKSFVSDSFFRKGIAGDWERVLSSAQIKRVVGEHKGMMRRFNYLDSTGEPQVS